MLLGKYENRIDKKGRAVLPAKLRVSLDAKLVLVKGFDKCLYLFSEKSWEKYAEEHVENRPDEDEDVRIFKSLFYANSMPVDIDKQGRINIPEEFLSYAGVKNEMINIGAVSRVEIWAKERYEKIASNEGKNMGDIVSKMKKYIEKNNE
ncbi:MAG: division/cell wall cluster transcriptional repressor MraZ [Clostridiales Family XIII bacterium]|jgi:MraZ protein|nr:division/cell wall cluster transcriptional repressor MraZ [Clostridiales Family XIII bacterium]